MAEKEEFTSLVRVKDFVEKRAAQIADLLKVVDNARLVSGEVTKGPRTAAQRLPRHMRRRAMAYEIRRFPKGLRKFASSFLISNHRKKPPCRFFRRRSRNLLLNYIRRQKKSIWLETHIWHAKRFHMIERWGYRLPDRCFQRNFRPIYRASLRHCTVRDKSYLNCFLVIAPTQEALLDKLKPFCSPAVSSTFAFRSALGGLYEQSTLLYKPGSYPEGLLGPARFQWSRNGSKTSLAIWIHPTSRDDLLPLLISALSLEKDTKKAEDETESTEVPMTYEDWKLRSCQVLTDVYNSADGQITMEDLKDQLVRFRFYGPKSLDVVRAAVQLSSQQEETYGESHKEWRKLARIDMVPDSRVFSLLVEDPRVSKPRAPKVPAGKEDMEEEMEQICPVPNFWSRVKRMETLKNRLTDQEMNKLKGRPVGGAAETPAKIPILVVIRHQGTGKQEPLDGVEVIAPTGFGRDLWLSAQMQTAHASGLRDDGAAHLEARCLAFPTDYLDSEAGKKEFTRMRKELEEKHEKRPHNRRVRHWKKLSVKFPYSFEFPQLVSDWTEREIKVTYVLRDRRAILEIDDWMRGKGKQPEAILSEHKTAMVVLKLSCLARGRPKRFALVCLPKTEDLVKIRECQYQGKPFLLREVDKNAEESSSEVSNEIEKLEVVEDDKREWKDIVSLDPSTREKQISLKPLFPSCKNVDKAMKRKILNRKKKEAKKRRVEVQKKRLEELNWEEEEKSRTSYRNSASRETVGRVLRGDYSFIAARGMAMATVPVSSLSRIVEVNKILLLRNITSKYYHPVRVSLLRQVIEM